MGDSQRDSVRENHSQFKPLFLKRKSADSHESLEFTIRANHPIRALRANRFARLTPLSPRLSMTFHNFVRPCASFHEFLTLHLRSPHGLWELPFFFYTLEIGPSKQFLITIES